MHTSPARGHRPAIAFTTTMAIWICFYMLSLPAWDLPLWTLAMPAGACLALGGWLAGRNTGCGVNGGVQLGLVITLINLIILGSFGRGEDSASVLVSALPAMGAFLAGAVLLCGLGAAIGSKTAAPREDAPWNGRLALVSAAMTFMLIVAGGIVTGLEEGMAVDGGWTSNGYITAFFPLEQMRSDTGIYVEHFHRLWGILVGLSMIVLTIYCWLTDSRNWLKYFCTITLLAVIVQGALGAARVDQANLVMAAFHGVFGQLIFSAIVMLAVFCGHRWKTLPEAQPLEGGRKDRTLSLALIFIVLLQLLIGATYRHLQSAPDPVAVEGMLKGALHGHITGAILVTGLTLFVCARSIGRHKERRPIFGMAMALVSMVSFQFAIGWLALAAVSAQNSAEAGETVAKIETWQVVTTSAHQVIGALILAHAFMLYGWTRRLVKPS